LEEEQMTEHMETLSIILKVVQILIVPLAGLFIKQIMALRKDLEGLRVKVTENEARLCNHPDNNALHEIALSVERLSGDVRGMGKEIGGLKNLIEKVDRIVERQEDHLLNGGK
jgi:ABC-type phosphate transport system auxiliary subunit